jgi:ABC-type nitrate/sulfonate/bicarbonate transport system substrate-binding protein
MIRILGALLTIFVLHTSVRAADRIRVGFPELAAQFIPLPLAEKKGFFQEEGVQAEFIRLRPTVALAALATGEIDYDVLVGNGIIAAIQGVPVKAVASFVPGAPIALIARPEFKSVQELKGKTIGLNTFGGSLEAVARLTFKHFGLDPDKEIKFLAMGGVEARFAGMKQGLTAATLGSAPLDFLGKKMGFVVLAKAEELFTYPISGLVASVKKIKDRPDEIKHVIKGGIKATRYIRQNRDGTIQVMTEWLKVDKEMAAATYESISKAFNEDASLPESGLRLVIDDAKRLGKANREVSLSEVADLSILREAQRDLGIAQK